MNWTNYHSHCHYCDGKMPPEKYVEAAIQANLKAYGFSSHCPVTFENPWSIRKEDFHQYLQEVDTLKKKYNDRLEIYKSLEIDYIPGIISPASKIIEDASLDYTIGSVHFVETFGDGTPWEIDGTTNRFKKGLKEIYDDNIKTVISKYFALTREMVELTCPDIVGHFDKIKMHNSVEPFFDENERWYQDEVEHTLEVIKASDAIVEVNTRGIYKKLSDEPYPGKMILNRINEKGIPICLNSDAHHPSEITRGFTDVAKLLMHTGFKNMKVLYRNEWKDVAFDEEGIKF